MGILLFRTPLISVGTSRAPICIAYADDASRHLPFFEHPRAVMGSLFRTPLFITAGGVMPDLTFMNRRSVQLQILLLLITMGMKFDFVMPTN